MKRCPAKSCTRPRGKDQVACRAHWFSLPPPLRAEIWRLYREMPGSQEHLDALAAAVEFLNPENL